jgi:DNA-binding Lrp family transcriptional regulator
MPLNISQNIRQDTKLMDDIDRRILNRIQSDFPIHSRPYLAIAEDLGIAEDTVLNRLKALKDSGIIRRIGANFAPEKLGYASTLCAAKVPESEIESFSREVNRFPGVTHNYQRDGVYNIWFTCIAPSKEELKEILKKISAETGGTEIIYLPAERVYKIKAHFDL